ncbi:nucleotidyl transferase AbiEii/AbiGii toxin family protein [Thermococcus waiotapuensis]|uniref:Nucleotidyl transferase AbiEii/AbiGii toxin family protein n=1 Tax=Thermococcus waiotapuensis TaxID=90909 RepID=A0AAE4T1W9_9EURY|nr:nucleotidyl transferase AbiEii/AbiGii toxin family protein [Thermococcus waiotapuensis]MDV3104690.1 nucleotidyl transferase AbiEii/AbiGii toxin family protein [Thermococcus waiotapuensis]
MIEDEIKQKAKRLGVPISTVEKDYAISWMLYGVWKSGLWRQLAFKGGTCIRKAYIEGYRFSEDLDYTLIGARDAEMFREILGRAVDFANEGPVKFMEPLIEERFGVEHYIGQLLGFQIKIPFRLLSRTGVPARIKMDITLERYEKILLPLQDKRVLHSYSDFSRFRMVRVKAYPLEEIFAEKVRALFQRTRPRDLYDVWALKEFIDLKTVLKILPEKFENKGVRPDLEWLKDNKEYYWRAWEKSLGHQLKELPEFERVWMEIMRFVEGITKEWG